MKTLDPRYLQFAEAYGSHPGYLSIPPQDRSACQKFTLLTAQKCSDQEDVEAAYGPALEEVRGLIDSGLLPGFVLPDAGSVTPSVEQHDPMQQVEPEIDPLLLMAFSDGDKFNNILEDSAPIPLTAKQKSMLKTGEKQQAALVNATAVAEVLGDRFLDDHRVGLVGADSGPALESVPQKKKAKETKAQVAARQADPIVIEALGDRAVVPSPSVEIVAVGGECPEDGDTAAEIIRLHGEIETDYHMSLGRAIRIGELLAQQKEALKHGEFLPWVAQHLPFSERTAQNYMRVFTRRVELISATVADLTKAYRLPPARKAKAQAASDEATAGSEAAAESAPNADAQPSSTREPGSGAQAREAEEQNQAEAQTDKPVSTGTAAADPAQTEEAPPDPAETDHPEEAADTGTTATKPTSQPDATPPAITFRQAFPVVMGLVKKKGPDLARKVIDKIASEVGLDVWTPSPLACEDLADLQRLMHARLESIARDDYDQAASWVEGEIDTLNGILQDAAPQDEEDEQVEEDE